MINAQGLSSHDQARLMLVLDELPPAPWYTAPIAGHPENFLRVYGRAADGEAVTIAETRAENAIAIVAIRNALARILLPERADEVLPHANMLRQSFAGARAEAARLDLATTKLTRAVDSLDAATRRFLDATDDEERAAAQQEREAAQLEILAAAEAEKP